MSVYDNRLGLLKRKNSHASLVEYPQLMMKRYTSIVAGSIQWTILQAARSIRTAFIGSAVRRNWLPMHVLLKSSLSIANLSITSFTSQLAALQLIENGKLKGDTPVSTYLPIFENPIILDDITKKKPSFKPATKVVLVQHLLNFSSGLFYPIGKPIHVLPEVYTAPHKEEDPVGHFYNVIKVSLQFSYILYVQVLCTDLFL